MRVGLLIAFAGRNCGGPEVYEREIVRALVDVAPQHEYELYCLDRRARQVVDVCHRQVTYHQLQPSTRAVAMLTTLPLAVRKTRPRVFHAPIITPPFCPARTLMAMPCSSLICHPEFYPPLIRMRLRFLLHRAVPKAAKVICPSEHVRDVVQETFRLRDDRLAVVQAGVDAVFQPIPGALIGRHVKERYGLDRPYFIYSGRWEPRKNVVRILEAFEQARREYRIEHVLALTGGRSWGARETLEVVQRLQLEESVIDLGKTPLADLPYLYGGADGLIYASLWEGFGLPIIEAMACGTPVITSNLSAMPETAGGAALLVDPLSTEAIAHAIYRLASDAPLRSRLRSLGLRRAQDFGWNRAAGATAALYAEVAAS